MRLVALTLVFFAVTAHADDRRELAKRNVDAGLAAQAAGKYDDAIALYKQAYDVVPHPEILFDLAQAYRLKGELETALEYYMKYLAAEPNGRVSKDAARWAGELEKQVAAKKAAAQQAKPVEPPPPPAPPPPPQAPAPPPSHVEQPPAVASTSAPPARRMRLAPWLFTGAAIVTAGAALGFDLWGNATYDDALKASDPTSAESLWHSANTKRYTADGLAVASVGCAAVAVWLFLRGGDEPSVQAVAGPGHVGIAWGRAW